MNKANLIKWSFWPILVAVILIGYTYISAEAVNKHLDFIPSNAKAVVILDSKYLANDFCELLQFNPTKIDEILAVGAKRARTVAGEVLERAREACGLRGSSTRGRNQ